MVKIMENPIKIGWFGVKLPPIFGNIQMNSRHLDDFFLKFQVETKGVMSLP